MAKRLKVSLLGILTVLVCFALSFGLVAWNITRANADGAETPVATVTLSDASDFVIDDEVSSPI